MLGSLMKPVPNRFCILLSLKIVIISIVHLIYLVQVSTTPVYMM